MANSTTTQLERTFPLLTETFDRAFASSFPAYLTSVGQSDPMNASPYVVSLSRLNGLGWSSIRMKLLRHLTEAIGTLNSHGVHAEAILLGGSFLDLGKEPRDLDCLILYSRISAEPSDLSLWQQEQRSRNLDIRMAPMETDPMLLLKLVIYFSVLYTRAKDHQDSRRGLLLVECSDA